MLLFTSYRVIEIIISNWWSWFYKLSDVDCEDKLHLLMEKCLSNIVNLMVKSFRSPMSILENGFSTIESHLRNV